MERHAESRTPNIGQETTETGLTALEAAERLGVNERTIRRAIARGELIASKQGGLFRITPESLDRFQSERLGTDEHPKVEELAGPETPQPIRPVSPSPKLVVVGAEPMVRTPLRQPLDSLIGREREVAELQDLLLRPEVRLLTLTGAGGVGKTRLALAAAAGLEDDFLDGVAFVPLASISEPGLVLPTIARALGLRDAGDRPIEEGLGVALRHREFLLVLDNFEQVVAGSPAIADLLSACPEMTVLATSREPLRIGGEYRFPVSPLRIPTMSMPTIAADLADFAGVALFLERANRVRPGFALTAGNAWAIAAICARLDGLPLAIEMAAAWLGTLSPDALLERLEYRLPLLTGGNRDLPDRQRTMRDAVAWSYDLLADDEQRCFRHVAVFVGGFTLEAAEAVSRGVEETPPSGGDSPPGREGPGGGTGHGGEIRSRAEGGRSSVLELVASLIEKSLLVQEPDSGSEPRYMMLETVREFGLERLAGDDEVNGGRDAHTAWCLALAQEAGPRVMDADQVHWLDRLEREHDNLRAAMAWSSQREDELTSLALVGALWEFWYIRGHVAEGLRWLEQALALGAGAPSAVRIWALIGAGQLAHYQGETAQAASHLERSLAMSRALADQGGAALSLLELGIMAEDRGDYDAATELLEESYRLYSTLAPSPSMSMTTYHLAVVAYGQGDLARADTLCDEALRLAHEVASAFSIAAVQTHVGLVACDRGDGARAAAALAEGVSLYAASKDLEGIARCLANFAVLATAWRHWHAAARLMGSVETLKEMIGYGFAYPEGPRYQRAEHAAQAALGAAFADLLATGRAWSIDEALAEALSLEGPYPGGTAAPVEANSHGLTPREREVLRLVAAGLSDREIADALFISRHTAMTHVANILTKLGLSSRTAAAALAVRDGLV